MQFKNIRHLLTEDKLRMSEDLEKHAGKMMASLDDIINNIDDVDYALDKMHKVAQQHRQFQRFSAQQFWVKSTSLFLLFVVYHYLCLYYCLLCF